MQKPVCGEEKKGRGKNTEKERISVRQADQSQENSITDLKSVFPDPPVERPHVQKKEGESDPVGKFAGQGAGDVPPPHGI